PVGGHDYPVRVGSHPVYGGERRVGRPAVGDRRAAAVAGCGTGPPRRAPTPSRRGDGNRRDRTRLTRCPVPAETRPGAAGRGRFAERGRTVPGRRAAERVEAW